MKKIRNDFKLSDAELDYNPDDSIFRTDDNRVHRLKHIISDKLTEIDRRIWLLYMELGSQRQVGVRLGVSLSTANHILNDIKRKIIEHYGNDN